LVIDAPGLCSPSRIVVSNTINRSLAMLPPNAAPARARGICFAPERFPAPAVYY
jgi:hypothetical protein